MTSQNRQLLSGDEAVALAALHARVALGAGYPGTPSTEILENFSALGGRAQWAPNEKVAFEVAVGAAFAENAAAIVTMKHVGLNVAADPLFTATYTGVAGALLVIVADDPGMASSQNEQDSRNYAKAAAIPMLEPSDSQQAYDFTRLGLELSHRWRIPVLLRMTTRVCHAKTVVVPTAALEAVQSPRFERDIRSRVMIPANARPAHRNLRKKLDEMQVWNQTASVNQVIPGDKSLGIITSGIGFMHAREAAPNAGFFKIGMTYPLPVEAIKQFAKNYARLLVIEEGDPWLVDNLRAEGINVEGKNAMYRFGELDVQRVKRILANDLTPEAAPPKGKPPQLCVGCPHRAVFELLHKLDCIVSGDIGCYTLGVLPPFEAMDSCVCMGASVGVGLGLRHVLPESQARKVVSVIGDSTFVHSGITGLVEMMYNVPKTGHLVFILDNGTTAMTGLQEHPGTGRLLDHQPALKLNFEELAKGIGIKRVFVVDPIKAPVDFENLVTESLAGNEPTLIITRRPCLLAAKKIRQYQNTAGENTDHV